MSTPPIRRVPERVPAKVPLPSGAGPTTPSGKPSPAMPRPVVPVQPEPRRA